MSMSKGDLLELCVQGMLECARKQHADPDLATSIQDQLTGEMFAYARILEVIQMIKED